MTIPGHDPTQSEQPASGAAGAAAQGSAATSESVADPARALRAAASGQRAASAGLGRARRLLLHFCVVGVLAAGGAAVIGGSRAALSAAMGVALAGLNLLLMQKITSAMTGSGAGGHDVAPGNPAWGLALPFKLVALVGVAYALVRAGVAQPVPLAMGFALLPLTGVFLPRPTSVPPANPGPPTQLASRHPRGRREAAPSRRQPAS